MSVKLIGQKPKTIYIITVALEVVDYKSSKIKLVGTH